MGDMVSWLVALAMYCSGIAAFVQTLDVLSSAGLQLADSWDMEYTVRLCAERRAAGHNIADAVEFLAHEMPESAVRIRDAGRRLLAALAESGSEASCRAGTFDHQLAAFAHRQRTPGLPLFWPNWIARLAPPE